MMETLLPRSWKEEFALAAAINRADILYEEKMRRIAVREQERRDEHREVEEKKEREETQEWEDAALANAENVAEARIKFEGYDANTVEALMDNREAAEAFQRKIEAARAEAYVLPDGRKVFKTLDGQKVFDERGAEVSREVVDPAAIDNRKTRWEPFKSAQDELHRLDVERQTLIDYQAKLDAARARLDKGDISEKDLKKLETDLAASAPERVRQKLGLDKPETPAKALRGSTHELIQKTGFVTSAPGPQ